ncbi:MAG: type II toxin-antitoxin system VapC family toxin [Bryobacteraceae bacterium]
MNLLDTSTLLWTLTTPERLSKRARNAIANGEPVLSIASYWEVVIKSGKGRLPVLDPVSWWTRAAQLFGGRVLPIRASHVTALASSPHLHRDPFDRILIPQAVAEGMPLITSDRQIQAYSVRVLW